MQPIGDILIAATPEIFDDQMKKSALIAKFATNEKKEAYAEKDAGLRQLIEDVGTRLFTPEFIEEHLFVIYDWWPNHTRYLEASVAGFTQAYFDGLRELLSGEYLKWRIQVVVYGNVIEGSTVIGSILIWPHKLLIDRELYRLLMSRDFDLRCDRAPRHARTRGQKEDLN